MSNRATPSLGDLYIDLLRDDVGGRWLLEPGTDDLTEPEAPAEHGERPPAPPATIGPRSMWEEGWGWSTPYPPVLTMIGRKRLDNLIDCVRRVVADGIPGDVIETGVWRGGACIVMRGVLRALDVTDRDVYVADSFAGLPAPDPRYPQDAAMTLHLLDQLAVPLEAVRANFERFGLLDHRVRFIEGWFKDTLPALRDRTWSLIRLDGDMYQSTMDALVNLYPALSAGGWCLIDDYHAYDECRQAVTDYRSQHNIEDPIIPVDWTGVCWRRTTRG